jgi:starch synthase
MNHVIMLAAENDALKGGKVGGVGDVVRDLPAELSRLGWKVTTVIPSYGFLHVTNPARLIGTIEFPFGGKTTTGELYEAVDASGDPNVRHLLFEHSQLRGEPIYFNDPPDMAYAQDATKFALFCSAMGRWFSGLNEPFIVHLHDWHMGFYLLLRGMHPDFRELKSHRTVFTVHNLAYQGNRPFLGKKATVESWFPELFNTTGWISEWKDPRYQDPNFTPIAAGIRYSDMVNTVSPTYAEEILRPSDHPNGFYGGEGLEQYLRDATSENRLIGILNGMKYAPRPDSPSLPFTEFIAALSAEVKRWNSAKPDPLHEHVLAGLERMTPSDAEMILTSVTRVTEQKVRLFYEKGSKGRTAMDDILTNLDDASGVYFFIGSGTADYEALLTQTCLRHPNFIYFKGYSDIIARALYRHGTLFMMPSSFEPCGIGQMIAMRDSQPCLVHATGGLRDTVTDGVNGFTFDGRTIREQVDGLVAAAAKAAGMFRNDPSSWNTLRAEAGRSRFTWGDSARKYIDLMYRA